jgi:hypothetical protein
MTLENRLYGLEQVTDISGGSRSDVINTDVTASTQNSACNKFYWP